MAKQMKIITSLLKFRLHEELVEETPEIELSRTPPSSELFFLRTLSEKTDLIPKLKAISYFF